MALGGGNFTSTNKVLPGTYINFISTGRASSNVSDRGYGALAIDSNFMRSGEIITVTCEDFQKNSLRIFGYEYGSAVLKGMRDLFKNIKTAYLYNLNTGLQAKCKLGVAKNRGTRGNDLTVAVYAGVDDSTKFDVITKLGSLTVDHKSGVTDINGLIDTEFVSWNKEATLEITAGINFTGGTDIIGTGAQYQEFLNKIENYSFNGLGCLSEKADVINLFVEFTKRMRDEVGAKFQTVVFRNKADYEGVISVENSVDEPNGSLVYWTLGAIASCPINEGLTNKPYNGEFNAIADYTQVQLIEAIKDGKFIFHKVGDDVRVLEDINTFISFKADKGEDFGSNQTIRVLDQIANDIALLFNSKYLGSIPNNEAGRTSLWNDIVTFNREMEKLQAIENFKADDVVVLKGNDKKSVIVQNTITPVNAMTKLYMTVFVD